MNQQTIQDNLNKCQISSNIYNQSNSSNMNESSIYSSSYQTNYVKNENMSPKPLILTIPKQENSFIVPSQQQQQSAQMNTMTSNDTLYSNDKNDFIKPLMNSSQATLYPSNENSNTSNNGNDNTMNTILNSNSSYSNLTNNFTDLTAMNQNIIMNSPSYIKEKNINIPSNLGMNPTTPSAMEATNFNNIRKMTTFEVPSHYTQNSSSSSSSAATNGTTTPHTNLQQQQQQQQSIPFNKPDHIIVQDSTLLSNKSNLMNTPSTANTTSLNLHSNSMEVTSGLSSTSSTPSLSHMNLMNSLNTTQNTTTINPLLSIPDGPSASSSSTNSTAMTSTSNSSSTGIPPSNGETGITFHSSDPNLLDNQPQDPNFNNINPWLLEFQPIISNYQYPNYHSLIATANNNKIDLKLNTSALDKNLYM